MESRRTWKSSQSPLRLTKRFLSVYGQKYPAFPLPQNVEFGVSARVKFKIGTGKFKSTQNQSETNSTRTFNPRSPFRPSSQAEGVRWIDPTASKEEKEEYDNLTVSEKQLRYLIGWCYPNLTDEQKGQKVYFWQVDYLNKLSEKERRKFLFEDPNLPQWENVFKRGTSIENIVFNIYFLSFHWCVLNPEIWAGHSLKFTIVLYYLFLTKRYIVFAKNEDHFYQYDGARWQKRSPTEIIEDVASWTQTVKIKDADRIINPGSDDTLIGVFKQTLAIEKWPFVMGRNVKNGFLTLRNNRYTLFPHNPCFWQKELYLVDIPPEIIIPMDDITLWLMLDWAGESIVALTLIKLLFCLVSEVGDHSLVFNINGMPRGSKTLLMEIIGDITGPNFHAGSLHALNSFQRRAAMLNTRIISFSDCNPKHLKPPEIDFIKALSGRDKLMVEEKNKKQHSMRADGLVIITNNENFDSVPAFKQEAMSDRVTNLEFPTVRSDAVVGGLKNKLGKDAVGSLFFFGQTISPELITGSQRAGDINAVTSSGTEKILIQFISQECIKVDNQKVAGKHIYETYLKFLKRTSPKATPINHKNFYTHFDHYLDKMEPKGISRKKTKAGMTYFNLLVGQPGQNVNFSYENFEYTGPERVRKMLESNHLKGTAIVFRDEKGNYVSGPPIDPSYTKDMFNRLQKVKDTSLKNIIEASGKPTIQKHFEETGFGGEKKIHLLTEKDFETDDTFFQPRLEYGVENPFGFLDATAVFKTELTPYLSGQAQPLIASPFDFFPSSIETALNFACDDFKWFSSYDLSGKHFCVDSIPDYSWVLEEELEQRKSGIKLGPAGPVQLVCVGAPSEVTDHARGEVFSRRPSLPTIESVNPLTIPPKTTSVTEKELEKPTKSVEKQNVLKTKPPSKPEASDDDKINKNKENPKEKPKRGRPKKQEEKGAGKSKPPVDTQELEALNDLFEDL